MPGERIRVVAPDVGGGFGGKGSLYPEEIFVCAAARLLARPVKWTSDRMEDLAANSQAFDEIIDAELALDNEGRIVGAARRRHRRCRRVFDLSVDGGARAGAGGEFPARAVSRSALSRPRPGGGDLESADRALSRRRPADFDLRHGAVDGHGGGEDRHRRQGHPAAQSRAARPSFPTRSRPASSGTNPAFRNACTRRATQSIRDAARQTESGARGRPLGRHRHRLLRRIDRHRLAHLGRSGHAHQYRHRNRDCPHR